MLGVQTPVFMIAQQALSIASDSLLISLQYGKPSLIYGKKPGTVGNLGKRLRLRPPEATALLKRGFSISGNPCEYSAKWLLWLC